MASLPIPSFSRSLRYSGIWPRMSAEATITSSRNPWGADVFRRIALRRARLSGLGPSEASSCSPGRNPSTFAEAVMVMPFHCSAVSTATWRPAAGGTRRYWRAGGSESPEAMTGSATGSATGSGSSAGSTGSPSSAASEGSGSGSGSVTVAAIAASSPARFCWASTRVACSASSVWMLKTTVFIASNVAVASRSPRNSASWARIFAIASRLVATRPARSSSVMPSKLCGSSGKRGSGTAAPYEEGK